MTSFKTHLVVISNTSKLRISQFIYYYLYSIDSSWTHVKEIPNTKLLVSLHHNWENSANMEILDISKKGQAKKIYSLEEVSGGKV